LQDETFAEYTHSYNHIYGVRTIPPPGPDEVQLHQQLRDSAASLMLQLPVRDHRPEVTVMTQNSRSNVIVDDDGSVPITLETLQSYRTITERLAEPFPDGATFHVLNGVPYLVVADWDHAERWDTNPPANAHPYEPLLRGVQVSKDDFHLIVRKVHGLDQWWRRLARALGSKLQRLGG
jgi:hypothetical protein